MRGEHRATWAARWVPGWSPGRGTGGPASESPGFAPHRRAQPERPGHRAQRRGVSVPGPCTWCPTLIRNDPSCTWRQSTPLPRPSSDRTQHGLRPGCRLPLGQALTTQGPEVRGGPVAAVMRVVEWAPDQAWMWEPVPPSKPLRYLLFPPGAAGRAPACSRGPVLTCGPSCSGGLVLD
jgi:hypothetical protein